jgi:hypothetical protein
MWGAFFLPGISGDLDLIKYREETLMAIAAFNVQGLKSVMMVSCDYSHLS